MSISQIYGACQRVLAGTEPNPELILPVPELMTRAPANMTQQELDLLPGVIAEYRTQEQRRVRDEQRKQEQDIDAAFGEALIATLPDHLRGHGEKLFEYAWREGHSDGYALVEQTFNDVAGIFT